MIFFQNLYSITNFVYLINAIAIRCSYRSVDESGQMHFCLLLGKIRRRHFAYLRYFVVLQLWPSKNALLVESGHLQIQHKKKQLEWPSSIIASKLRMPSVRAVPVSNSVFFRQGTLLKSPVG